MTDVEPTPRMVAEATAPMTRETVLEVSGLVNDTLDEYGENAWAPIVGCAVGRAAFCKVSLWKILQCVCTAYYAQTDDDSPS